jgi:hypothetical protein
LWKRRLLRRCELAVTSLISKFRMLAAHRQSPFSKMCWKGKRAHEAALNPNAMRHRIVEGRHRIFLSPPLASFGPIDSF